MALKVHQREGQHVQVPQDCQFCLLCIDAETVLVAKVTKNNKKYQLLTLVIRLKGLNAAAELPAMLRPVFLSTGFCNTTAAKPMKYWWFILTQFNIVF